MHPFAWVATHHPFFIWQYFFLQSLTLEHLDGFWVKTKLHRFAKWDTDRWEIQLTMRLHRDAAARRYFLNWLSRRDGKKVEAGVSAR